ncbi:MAG: N-acetyltransferase [Ignavibacteriales bacterium]|nr:N-acetyltransferase [Ignavibacteriales bacterium]
MTSENQKIKIRIADYKDWQSIIDIYNQAVLEKDKTADTQPITVEERKDWLQQHSLYKYPILLAEINNIIVGWCSISPHRPGRKALEITAEISYYINKNYRKKGVGSFLIEEAISSSRKKGIKNLFAILLDINLDSVSILEKFGFQKWGHLPNVAEIDGKTCGQFIYGKHI